MTKEELQVKYPRHKVIYDPIANCRHCHGKGEMMSIGGKARPCVCVCIHHDVAEQIQDVFNRYAQELREDIEKEKSENN
jgi:hypothetical protein